MPRSLSSSLKDLQKHVEAAAKEYGLDGFECIYEMLDYDEINMVAAYCGFPVRYPHWRWGMEYDRLKKGHEYGLNKIYEMVINNDPCYAYLMESNSWIDQKLVMCHVTGHNDFFKHNFAFSHTNRSMINEMANHASRIRRYMDVHGTSQVESFIDCLLSLENLIDINSPYIERVKKYDNVAEEVKTIRFPNEIEYMEPYLNPEEKILATKEVEKKEVNSYPKHPEQDVLKFLLEHAPLKPWQADIVDIIRKEAYYFAPQAMTKIMNEGWASYWHAKLMTEKMMEPNELIDFADRHSSVMATAPNNLNPYKLGVELYRNIEERWDKGKFGLEWERCESMSAKGSWDNKARLGTRKIFEVRKIYNDLTFIDEFLTLDFCREHGLFTYHYDARKKEYVIESRDFSKIKTQILRSLTNLGQPVIKVVNGNYENRAELLLEHLYDGVPLDINFARETLKNLSRVWSRPAHLMTKIDDRTMLLSHNGENYAETLVSDDI